MRVVLEDAPASFRMKFIQSECSTARVLNAEVAPVSKTPRRKFQVLASTNVDGAVARYQYRLMKSAGARSRGQP